MPGRAGVGGGWGSALEPWDPGVGMAAGEGLWASGLIEARGSRREGLSARLQPVTPPRGSRSPTRARPKMAPLPHPLPRARLRCSGRGPAARALLGGGCCDGEAAAEPEPCSLSHLRHLGLGPPRAGRSCPCRDPARAVGSRPPVAGGPRSPNSAAARVLPPGPIPARGPPTAYSDYPPVLPLTRSDSSSVLTPSPPRPLRPAPLG